MAERRFEFNEGSSSKFWAIERRARKVTVMFGRIGSEGQKKAKSFSTDGKAAHEEERLVAEKLRKGYREVKGGAKVKAPPAKKVAAAPKTAVKAQGGKGKTTYRQIEHLVWVDQHVISFKDAKTDWDGRWTNDAFGKEKGIGVAEGVVSLVDFARAAGHVPMLFEIHAERPATDDVDDYEAVLEASIRLPSRKISIENEGGSEGTVSVPDATDWRLRAYFANGDTARYDCGDGAEHARIVLYPGPSAATDVMKLRKRGLGELVRKYRGPRSDAELKAMLLGPNLSHRCLATVALLQKGRLDLVRWGRSQDRRRARGLRVNRLVRRRGRGADPGPAGEEWRPGRPNARRSVDRLPRREGPPPHAGGAEAGQGCPCPSGGRVRHRET